MFVTELRKVQLTVLSDKLCKEMGNIKEDNLGGLQVVNTKKELCGAFVNTMNITFVNYTVKAESKVDKKDPDYDFSKLDIAKEVNKDSNYSVGGMFR